MPFQLICVGQKMPAWIDDGFADYQKRLVAPWTLTLHEIALSRRGKHADLARCKREEGENLLAAVAPGARVVALDERGQQLSTLQLARRCEQWLQHGARVALLVGGPDGLAAECLARAEVCWSLSPLTLPHGLVRILVAEQLYRAWSLLQHHPYHRAS